MLNYNILNNLKLNKIKILIYILTSNFFLQYLESMTQELNELILPPEINLIVLEHATEQIMKKNTILNPFKGVISFINKISSVNSEFYSFKNNLIKFAKRYAKFHFTPELINMKQEDKDQLLKDIFENTVLKDGLKQEIEVASGLIISGADPNLIINTKYEHLKDNSILSLIAKSGFYIDLFNLLIFYGANINAKNKLGNTALMHAIRYKHIDMAKILLKCVDIDLNIKNDRGETVFAIASCKGDIDMIKLLLDNNNPDKETKRNIDINTQDIKGCTPLITAIRGNHKDVTKLLLEQKDIDLNVKDIFRSDALIVAIIYKQADVIALLLKHGKINVNTKNDNYNALSYAIKHNYKDIAKMLINHENIDVNIRDNTGKTPLTIALDSKQKDIIEALIKHKNININTQEKNKLALIN